MNKSDLIDIISKRSRLGRKKVESAVDLVFGSMGDALARGDRIELRGFGSFAVRSYGSYAGRNPRTGEHVEVRPKKLPHFKVGKELKDMVDGRHSDERPASPQDVTET